MTETIGIRELRQNASQYIERAERGEEIIVTRRGEPVAVITAVSPIEREIERLVREHGATPPTAARVDFLSFAPVVEVGVSSQEALDATREERFS